MPGAWGWLLRVCVALGSSELLSQLGASPLVIPARAGFITVTMSQPQQCASSVVEWYGDDGPYHLLMTPTAFVEHGYNIWIPSIPNGTLSYDLTLDQPAGMRFVVTVWGASGVEYAGTTDVLTVGSSDNSTCFISDDALNRKYTFAFNMTNSQDGLPAQCSNLSLTWPTSLESALPDTIERRTIEEVYGRDGDDSAQREAEQQALESLPVTANLLTEDTDTSSSNMTSGNTTIPPTMFGIIPLGNSFSIPITYSKKEKFVSGLPQSSLSDNPTTWTSRGVTHMNWTVGLAKGTRFILVAGIGSQEQWASGGSSEMMTVGQGDGACMAGGSGPGVTASATATGKPHPTSGNSDRQSGVKSWNGVIVACVFSVLATLILAILFYCCCRIRNKRRDAVKHGEPKPSIVSVATFGRLERKRTARRVQKYDQDGTQMDLIGGDEESIRPQSTFSNATRPYSTVSMRPSSAFSMSSGPPLPNINTGPYRANEFGAVGSSPDDIYRDVPLSGAQARGSRLVDEAFAYPYGYTPTSSPVVAAMPGPNGTVQRMRQAQPNTAPDQGPYHQVGMESPTRQDLIGGRHGDSIDGLVSYPAMAHAATSSISVAPSGMAVTPAPILPPVPLMSSEMTHNRSTPPPSATTQQAFAIPTHVSTTTPALAPVPVPTSTVDFTQPIPNDARGPLLLRDPGVTPDPITAMADASASHLAELKRETLATLESSAAVVPPVATVGALARRRPRRQSREEATYIVHRDAGRVVSGPSRPRPGRTVELPPRYEELNWDEDPLLNSPAEDAIPIGDMPPRAPHRSTVHTPPRSPVVGASEVEVLLPSEGAESVRHGRGPGMRASSYDSIGGSKAWDGPVVGNGLAHSQQSSQTARVVSPSPTDSTRPLRGPSGANADVTPLSPNITGSSRKSGIARHSTV